MSSTFHSSLPSLLTVHLERQRLTSSFSTSPKVLNGFSREELTLAGSTLTSHVRPSLLDASVVDPSSSLVPFLLISLCFPGAGGVLLGSLVAGSISGAHLNPAVRPPCSFLRPREEKRKTFGGLTLASPSLPSGFHLLRPLPSQRLYLPSQEATRLHHRSDAGRVRGSCCRFQRVLGELDPPLLSPFSPC